MNLHSLKKVLAAGFRIIRSDDTPAPRIKYLKYRASSDAVWVTLEDGFASKAARDRRFKELLKDKMTVED